MKARWLALGLAAWLLAGCAGLVASQRVPVTSPKPATLTADLYTPDGPGPFPAVILLHGCGGMSPNVSAWARWLQWEGYAALALDSFGGRGLGRLCGDSSPLPGPRRSEDVFAAAAHLRSLPGIDGERIAAMGFSHGGWTVLWASQRERLHPDVRLRALVAVYPFCGNVRPLTGSAPLLMLLGGKDDWTLPAPCQRLAEEARQRERVVSAITYPDAYHAFDSAQIRWPVLVRDARRGLRARVGWDPGAHGDAEKQVRRFLGAHLRG